MNFFLYFRTQRTGHCLLHKDIIKASCAKEAFKKAVDIIKGAGKNPDDFKELYISPVNQKFDKDYTTRVHGWDNYGSFPRKRR